MLWKESATVKMKRQIRYIVLERVGDGEDEATDAVLYRSIKTRGKNLWIEILQ